MYWLFKKRKVDPISNYNLIDDFSTSAGTPGIPWHHSCFRPQRKAKSEEREKESGVVPFVLIAAAGKLALGGHDFSIILQVGRAGLVPAPLVGESMQLMPIIGGQRWVAGGGRAESSNMWEEEAGEDFQLTAGTRMQ